jgi:hypothetical protein
MIPLQTTSFHIHNPIITITTSIIIIILGLGSTNERKHAIFG